MPEKTKAPKFKFSAQMGPCADRLYTLKIARSKLGQQVKLLEEEESALKEHLIQNLPKSKASGVAGKLARVTIGIKEVPQVEDWDAFYKHVRKTGAFELMQRRLSSEAIEERWAEKKKVPGVICFKAKVVSLNKV